MEWAAMAGLITHSIGKTEILGLAVSVPMTLRLFVNYAHKCFLWGMVASQMHGSFRRMTLSIHNKAPDVIWGVQIFTQAFV